MAKKQQEAPLWVIILIGVLTLGALGGMLWISRNLDDQAGGALHLRFPEGAGTTVYYGNHAYDCPTPEFLEEFRQAYFLEHAGKVEDANKIYAQLVRDLLRQTPEERARYKQLEVIISRRMKP